MEPVSGGFRKAVLDVSFFGSSGPIYPLAKFTLGKACDKYGLSMLMNLVAAASKHSGELVKKLSGEFRPIADQSMNTLDRHFYYQNEIKAFYRWRDSGYLDAAIDACMKQIAVSREAKEEFRTNAQRNAADVSSYQQAITELRQFTDGDDGPAKVARESIANLERMTEALQKKRAPDPSKFHGPEHTGFNQLCIILEKQGKYQQGIDSATRALEERWSGDWDKRIAKLKAKRDKVKK